MHKIQSLFKRINRRVSETKVSTPTSIIIGSIIIAAGIVAYGYIVRPSGTAAAVQNRNLVKEVAKELKLKGSKWETCLASPEVTKQVGREFNDGSIAGVTGTPTTYILVKKGSVYETAARIEGAQAESVVRAAVDQALSGTAKTEAFAGLQISDDEFVNGTRSDVVMVEYADAECPFCIRFHPTILNIMDTHGDRVGFVYRHFPLSFHPNAVPYAVAIECAGEIKGKEAYFGFIDKLFEKEAEN